MQKDSKGKRRKRMGVQVVVCSLLRSDDIHWSSD